MGSASMDSINHGLKIFRGRGRCVLVTSTIVVRPMMVVSGLNMFRLFFLSLLHKQYSTAAIYIVFTLH